MIKSLQLLIHFAEFAAKQGRFQFPGGIGQGWEACRTASASQPVCQVSQRLPVFNGMGVVHFREFEAESFYEFTDNLREFAVFHR